MKRILSIILVLSLLLTTFVTSSFAANDEDGYKVKEMKYEKKLEFLEENGIPVELVEFIEPTKLSKETRKELYKKEKEAKKNGLEYDGVFVYKINSPIIPMAVQPGPGGGSSLNTYNYTTSYTQEFQRNTGSGLRVVVRTLWDITIGIKTKHAWKIASVISRSTSEFLDYYVSGDYAKDIVTTWKTFTVYEGIPEWATMNEMYDLVKVVSIKVKTRSIIAGVSVTGQQ